MLEKNMVVMDFHRVHPKQLDQSDRLKEIEAAYYRAQDEIKRLKEELKEATRLLSVVER
jgi:septation ring formation regulator EzrA